MQSRFKALRYVLVFAASGFAPVYAAPSLAVTLANAVIGLRVALSHVVDGG